MRVVSVPPYIILLHNHSHTHTIWHDLQITTKLSQSLAVGWHINALYWTGVCLAVNASLYVCTLFLLMKAVFSLVPQHQLLSFKIVRRLVYIFTMKEAFSSSQCFLSLLLWVAVLCRSVSVGNHVWDNVCK